MTDFRKIDPYDLIEALALYTEWIKMYIFVHSRHWSLKKLCNHSRLDCIKALNEVINLTTPFIRNTVEYLQAILLVLRTIMTWLLNNSYVQLYKEIAIGITN